MYFPGAHLKGTLSRLPDGSQHHGTGPVRSSDTGTAVVASLVSQLELASALYTYIHPRFYATNALWRACKDAPNQSATGVWDHVTQTVANGGLTLRSVYVTNPAPRS